jgi:hypothetical protein
MPGSMPAAASARRKKEKRGRPRFRAWHALASPTLVVPREGGGSSTPRLLESITGVSIVIASEAKQSMVRHNGSVDCFVAFAPRNDEIPAPDMIIRSRGANPPEVCIFVCPHRKQRAQGRPGARCTRGLMCNLRTRTRTRAYRSSGEHPAFPAQWFDGVLRALPGVRIPLATVISGLTDGAGPVGPAHPPRT